MTRYRIVPERSRVVIDGRSSIHPIHSSTEGLEGSVELEIDADGHVVPSPAIAGSVSFPADRLSSGNRLEDRELQRRIDTRRYPHIEGTLSSIERSGDGSYRVSGEIRFRGVVRNKTDEMKIERLNADTVHLSGSSTFDIRDYGMEPPRILAFRVEPEVRVSVDITAVRED